MMVIIILDDDGGNDAPEIHNYIDVDYDDDP